MQFKEFVKIREEKFGSVIFDTLREKVFVTNQTGKDIINLLEDGHNIEKIVDMLANIYATDRTEMKNDINSFVNQLRDNNIITQ